MRHPQGLFRGTDLMYARHSMAVIIGSSRSLILLQGAILGMAGCSPSAPPSPAQTAQQRQPSPEYRLTATIQDLMDGIIDPSADVLWDSVAYIATTKGVEDRQPRTDEEWKAVRNSAVTLIEAANLLSMPGRQVLGGTERANGPATATGSGELTHAEIQQRINSTHEAFVQFARNLRDTGLKALAAIDRKDAQGLMDAGGLIDEACEACHVTYWYPNQNRPSN
jgi:hypothetical protein